MSNVSHYMNKAYLRIALIIVLGGLAPIWWTWVVSKLILAFFILGGSPEHPSSFFAWASILIPSLILGLTVGLLLSILARGFILKGWLLFWFALFLGTLTYSFAFGIGSGALGQLFNNSGNLIFLVGTLLLPLAICVRARRG